MRSVNRFSEEDATLSAFDQIGSWTHSNVVFNAKGLSTFRPGNYRQVSMNQINTSLPGVISIAGVQGDAGDLNADMTFTFAVRMVSGGLVTAQVTETVYSTLNYSETINITSTTNVYSVSNNFGSGVQTFDWTIIRLKPFKVTGTGTLPPSFNFVISFQPAELNETFFFTSPVLMRYYELLEKNSALIDLYTKIPDWIFQKEISSTSNPNIQMTRFMDIGSDYIDRAIEYLYKFLYVDTAGGFNANDDATRSTLVDPKVAEYQTLLWLLVFTFTKPVTRYELSPDYLPDPFILDESELDGTDRLLLTTSGELTPPIISRAIQIALLRWQAETSYYGGFAGTLPAVREAAKQMLTGNKTITITYDYSTTPWVINLLTPWNETFGGDISLVGSPSDIVLEAVSYAKPLGVLVNHQMTAAV